MSLLPSTIDVLVQWAKANSAISAVTGTNVSSTLPGPDKDMSYPWLQIQRVIGVSLFMDMPVDRARVQFNAWGGVKANGLPNWAPADTLIRTVEAEIREFPGNQTVGDAVIMEMTGQEGIMQLQDPDDNSARFWMDAIVVVRSVS